jgi:hypothetical protein
MEIISNNTEVYRDFQSLDREAMRRPRHEEVLVLGCKTTPLFQDNHVYFGSESDVATMVLCHWYSSSV